MKKILLVIFAFLAGSGLASAKGYPSGPIKLVVPYSVGGPSDIIARIVSEKAAEKIGSPIIVENRGGAGGTIGTALVARSAPDGYTAVMVSPGQIGIAVATRPDLSYKPGTDLVPIIELVEDTLILSVSKNLPVRNFPELIALLKANPGKYNYSSASVGSITHLMMELLKQSFGVEVTHIPFKGSAESMSAILSGQVVMGFASPSGMTALLQQGKLRALAIASSHRSSVMPDVPTMAEMGYPKLDVPLWYVLAVPKGTPEPIQKILHDAYAAALEDASVQTRMKALGVNVINAGPKRAAELMREDIQRWKTLVKTANIKLDQ